MQRLAASLPRWLSGKEFTCQCRRCRGCGFDPRVGKIPWGGMATHNSMLAGKISWTEEPSGLQSMGSQTIRHWASMHVTLFSTKKYYKMFSGTLCLQDSDSFYETESSMVTCSWAILSHTIYNWIICGRTSQSLNLLYQWALCRGQHRAFRIFQSHLSQATSVPANICQLHCTILSLISDSCRGSLWVWWEKNMTSLFSSLTTNNKLPLS